jgi:predicted  nucleic acid-binding Zn-ribbon protein
MKEKMRIHEALSNGDRFKDHEISNEMIRLEQNLAQKSREVEILMQEVEESRRRMDTIDKEKSNASKQKTELTKQISKMQNDLQQWRRSSEESLAKKDTKISELQ